MLKKIYQFIEGIEVATAFEQLDLGHDRAHFKHIGSIDYLTRSRCNRKELVKKALLMSFQQFENEDLYP